MINCFTIILIVIIIIFRYCHALLIIIWKKCNVHALINYYYYEKLQKNEVHLAQVDITTNLKVRSLFNASDCIGLK